MVYFDPFLEAAEVKFSNPSDYGFKAHKDIYPTGRDELTNHCLTSPCLQAVCFSTRL